MESVFDRFKRCHDVKAIVYDYCIDKTLVVFREPYDGPDTQRSHFAPTTPYRGGSGAALVCFAGLFAEKGEVNQEIEYLNLLKSKRTQVFIDQFFQVDLSIAFGPEYYTQLRQIECSSRYPHALDLRYLPKLEMLILDHLQYVVNRNFIMALLRDRDDEQVRDEARHWAARRRQNGLPLHTYIQEATTRQDIIDGRQKMQTVPSDRDHKVVSLRLALRFRFRPACKNPPLGRFSARGVSGVEILYEVREKVTLSKIECRLTTTYDEFDTIIDVDTLEVPRIYWLKVAVVRDALDKNNGIEQTAVDWRQEQLNGAAWYRQERDGEFRLSKTGSRALSRQACTELSLTGISSHWT